MERLGAEDTVKGAIRKRDLFCRASESLRPLDQRTQRLIRLDRYHPVEAQGQQPRELASPRGQIQHVRRARQPRHLNNTLWIPRTATLVVLRYTTEATPPRFIHADTPNRGYPLWRQ